MRLCYIAVQVCLTCYLGSYEHLIQAALPAQTPHPGTRTDKDFLALAGLYDTWKAPERDELRSCVIITTTPNELVAPVHNRMPVILTEVDEAAWLNPDETETEALLSMLRPAPDDLLHAQVA
jgi:putative SOS response-associated peptidase YedK